MLGTFYLHLRTIGNQQPQIPRASSRSALVISIGNLQRSRTLRRGIRRRFKPTIRPGKGCLRSSRLWLSRSILVSTLLRSIMRACTDGLEARDIAHVVVAHSYSSSTLPELPGTRGVEGAEPIMRAGLQEARQLLFVSVMGSHHEHSAWRRQLAQRGEKQG